MPIPQVTDRIKEAPAVVLRTIFAGIGQLLMAADKVRAQVQEQLSGHAQAARPEPTAAARPEPTAAGPTQRKLEETGNVTVLREPPAGPGARPAEAGPGKGATSAVRPIRSHPAAPAAPAPPGRPAPSAQPAPGAKPAPAPQPAAARPAPAPQPAAAKPAPAASAPAPPIPGYDDLSVASLRARLRGLDADGLRALLAYERAHAHRDELITMFERRLQKIGQAAG